MQALLVDVPLPTLQLLKKVNENALKEEKYRLLKRTNDTCRSKLIEVPEALQVLHVLGSTLNDEGLVCEEAALKKVQAGLASLEKALEDKASQSTREYEERKAVAAARAMEIQQKQAEESFRKEMELKKIKSIQSDVRERPVKASHADVTMGRSKEAEGIFAGAGGKSSSAKTFSDIGVALH